jgi:metallo-beta-lactamase class B
MAYIRFGSYLFLLMLFSCKTPQSLVKPYETETLKIVKLTDKTFVHITYLQTESFGKVPCNGLIFMEHNEAIVFDTPANDTASGELIRYIETQLKCKPKAVVINHFHADCLGGLKAFHQRNIPSYAHSKTIELAKKSGVEIPQLGFDGKQELTLGNKKIINQFYGEGHTQDNIVSYIPSENVLFGGCLIKEVGAGFGYLGDANTKEWSNTVIKIKKALPNLKFVIPGHGEVGGIELLDYTIEKFKGK